MSDLPRSFSRSSLTPVLDQQRRALAQIASGAALKTVLNQLARDAEALDGGAVRVAILLVDVSRQRLLHGASPSLPDAYAHAMERLDLDALTGRYGATAPDAHAVLVTDLATDPVWAPFRDLAQQHGLSMCWTMPIHGIGGHLLGVLACHPRTSEAPVAEDAEAMMLYAHTIALVLEQHGSERARRAAEDRHRQIFDSATDFAIIATDLQGRVTDWNEGAQRILGWSEQEMLGHSLHTIFTPEDVANGRPETEMRCALTQGYSPDERWHLRKSGERFWAAGQLTPLKNDSNEVIGFVKILRDHTEKKQADEKLHQLTTTLEVEVAQRTRERDRLWRNSLDLLLVIGPDGVLRAINPVWTAVLGYEPEELIGHYFEPFVHPDDVKPTIEAITQASQGPLDHFEVRLRHKYGSYRWFAWRASPEEGLVYANGRDITVEKQQAEQLLQANETRLSLALEAGEMGAWEWHLQTGTVVWLHGTAALHGVPADAPTTLPMDTYLQRHVHPDDRDGLVSVMARAVAEGNDHRTEYRIVRPDGQVRWLGVRGCMLSDETGSPSRMIGISTDITGRKRTEQDLRFLAQASAELASLVDPQSTLDRLVYLAVPHFADWCAIDLLQEDGTLKRAAVAHTDPERVKLAHEIHRRFPPDPASPIGVWNVIRSGRPDFVREVTDDLMNRVVTDPERVAIMMKLGFRSFISVPLSAHGKVLGAASFFGAESGRLFSREDVALAEDLARRVAIAIENADLYRTLRATDQAKDVFLATLAHELRNPLAAIVSGLDLLTMVGDQRHVEQYTKLMQRQAAQLTRLVDDLLDVSRITTGKIELKKEVTSLAGVLNQAIETSRPDIEAGHHRLSVLLPGEPTDLLADPVRLTQVFSNLLTNAAKFTKPGGKIQVTLDVMPDEFIVRVRDTGIGIPADMLKNIFKLFTQATHPIQRDRGGLGIGLSLVDGLVRLHGGTVEAFSAGTNQGAEFVVRLPRAMASDVPVAPGAAIAAPPRRQARRVLIVDDNVDAANTVAEILRMLGHEVETVHDGLAGVSAAATMKPDVILLDIGLPGIDGYEVARRIRAQAHTRRSLVLIAVTGWGQPSDRQQAQEAGFDSHWVKPVSLEQLQTLF